MARSLRSSQGFTAVEGLIVLVVVALVGFAGWYVWQASNNTDTQSVKNKSKSSGVVSTKHYSDEFVSFDYPSGWQAKRTDNTGLPGTKELQINGPLDRELPGYDPTLPQTGHLLVEIWKNGSTPTSECKTCKVYWEQQLDNQNIPEARLLFAPSYGEDKSTLVDGMQFVTDQNAVVGKVGYNAAVKMGNGYGFVIISMTSHNPNDINAMRTTTSYKSLLQILDSLKFN
jgi:hypothetical protein